MTYYNQRISSYIHIFLNPHLKAYWIHIAKNGSHMQDTIDYDKKLVATEYVDGLSKNGTLCTPHQKLNFCGYELLNVLFVPH